MIPVPLKGSRYLYVIDTDEGRLAAWASDSETAHLCLRRERPASDPSAPFYQASVTVTRGELVHVRDAIAAVLEGMRPGAQKSAENFSGGPNPGGEG